MYEIEFSKTAEKELYKLDKEIQLRVISALERIRIRPYSYVKRLVGSQYFRLRIGDYRVLYEIKWDKNDILIVNIDKRPRAYNK